MRGRKTEKGAGRKFDSEQRVVFHTKFSAGHTYVKEPDPRKGANIYFTQYLT